MKNIEAFTAMGFVNLDVKKELHRENYKACNTKTQLKFCNRVQVYKPLTFEDKREIENYYRVVPFVYFVLEDNQEVLHFADNLDLKKLTQFPILCLKRKEVLPQRQDSNLEIIKLMDRDKILTDWAQVCARGYNTEANAFKQFTNYLLTSKAFPDMHFYIAKYQGHSVASCMWIERKELADVHWISTLAEFRTKGIGRAITIQALNDIPLGKDVYLYSSVAGYPLYKSLGFEDVSLVHVFE